MTRRKKGRNICRGIMMTSLLLWTSLFSACSAPPIPSEVTLAETQDYDLWRSGAETYAPLQYSSYRISYRMGRHLLLKENAGFAPFRNYDEVTSYYQTILSEGSQLGELITLRKRKAEEDIKTGISSLSNRIDTLKKLSTLFNEGRISRKDITTADLLVMEARQLYLRGAYSDAKEKLILASSHTDKAVHVVSPILDRYVDSDQITKWRSLADETVLQSKRKGAYAIVVSKLDRLLFLYKNGNRIKSFPIGVGINGSKDKHFAGDRATPEGIYRITRKLSSSRFYKALLINYPNEDDKKQFNLSKKRGLIPPGAGIGGLIEIHGGGSDSMTFGCIAMENNNIDELFAIVNVGTPVTIVGSMHYQNDIAQTMKDL